MPTGGRLMVRGHLDDGAYSIVFTDSGRGMSEGDLASLFQPFRTNFPSGTGLGMAISYRIVQEHGGRIDVALREGSGTTITVSLPVRVRTPLAGVHAPTIPFWLVKARMSCPFT